MDFKAIWVQQGMPHWKDDIIIKLVEPARYWLPSYNTNKGLFYLI